MRRLLAEVASLLRDTLLLLLLAWTVGAVLGVAAVGFRMIAG